MKVLVTGAHGFVGKNLLAHFRERPDIQVVTFTRDDELTDLITLVAGVDFIFHLAGINRPENPGDFKTGNTDLTHALCDAVKQSGKVIPVVYTSSSQARLDNPYGVSKRGGEQALENLNNEHGSSVFVFRLPNVFGKWAKPNYNSAVATFCHNIARGLPIQINDADAQVTLVYIDDVIASFIDVMNTAVPKVYKTVDVEPQYSVTIGSLAKQLRAFHSSRENLISEAVGTGFVRALYSTYVSYLPPKNFAYEVPKYEDERGVFVEMLKTKDAGQFSFFTAHPGVTRGGHYHHSKTEKFLVIKGKACFRFRDLSTGEFRELLSCGDTPTIVETAPGWTHDVTNVGEDEMIVMLWANEIFDREKPDTFTMPVGIKA